MVADTLNYWNVWTFSVLWHTREHNFSGTASVSVVRRGGGRNFRYVRQKALISITDQRTQQSVQDSS
jgi:hypothetical protein